MIPVLLFFGLCFFGLGDCQDEPIIENSNQTIDWSVLPNNSTAIKEYKLEINEMPLSWSSPDTERDMEYYNCTEYEKVGDVLIYHFSEGSNSGVEYEKQCVPLSNEEIIIKQNNEILEILREQKGLQDKVSKD